MTEPKWSPRERMVFSAAQLIRRNGVESTGLREVVVHAEASRGSLQHYFPGGKDQLVDEAVRWAGRYAAKRVARFVAEMPQPSPGRLLAAMVGQWTDEFAEQGFDGGCPVAAATVDRANANEATRSAAAEAFACWAEPLAGALTDMGVPPDRSPGLATMMISAVEGALLIARAERNTRALTTLTTELAPLLDQTVPAH